jgi:hypothetical protein
VHGHAELILRQPYLYTIVHIGSIDNPEVSVEGEAFGEFDLVEVRSGDVHIKVGSGRVVLVIFSWDG